MSIGVDAAAKGAGDVPEIGVGMLGYAFMGKAHANGYKTLPYMAWPPPLRPRRGSAWIVPPAGSGPVTPSCR